MGDSDMLEAATSFEKIHVKTWGEYLGESDWLHERVFSSAAQITNFVNVPQKLFDITSDVPSGNVLYFDWMAGSNDIKGFCVRVKKDGHDYLDVYVDLRFRLVDFNVFFSNPRGQYGFSNIFTDDVDPKNLVDAFWTGTDQVSIRRNLDNLIRGRLEQNM